MNALVENLVQGIGGKTAKKMGNTISGGVEHAVIAFCDLREKDIEEKDNKTSQQSGVLGAFNQMKSDVTSKIKNFAEEHAPSITAMIGKMIDGPDLGEDVKKYEVQFNPTSLKMQASVADDDSKVSMEVSKAQMEYGANEINVMMSATLIFDESDVLLIPKHSVQKQVEGFLSAIGNESTRAVLFMWGNMCYEGILDGIDGKYTMFDENGMPIRAEMEITINCCAISTAKEASAQRPLGVWQEAYQEFISSSSGMSTAQTTESGKDGLFHFFE